MCILCHLLPRRQTEHSPPCTSLHTHKFAHPLEHEGNKKYGLNILLLLFHPYCSRNYKFLSKFHPLTVNSACLCIYSKLTTWGKPRGSEHKHCIHPAIIKFLPLSQVKLFCISVMVAATYVRKDTECCTHKICGSC